MEKRTNKAPAPQPLKKDKPVPRITSRPQAGKPDAIQAVLQASISFRCSGCGMAHILHITRE